MTVEWNRAREEVSKHSAQIKACRRKWCKPPDGWIKVNTDAACHLRTGRMGVGCIIRDDRGCFIRARSKVIQGRLQPREVEAIGLREALSWTKEWRMTRCIFECDAKSVVDAFHTAGGHS